MFLIVHRVADLLAVHFAVPAETSDRSKGDFEFVSAFVNFTTTFTRPLALDALDLISVRTGLVGLAFVESAEAPPPDTATKLAPIESATHTS